MQINRRSLRIYTDKKQLWLSSVSIMGNRPIAPIHGTKLISSTDSTVSVCKTKLSRLKLDFDETKLILDMLNSISLFVLIYVGCTFFCSDCVPDRNAAHVSGDVLINFQSHITRECKLVESHANV